MIRRLIPALVLCSVSALGLLAADPDPAVAAERIVRASGVPGGLVLHVGAGDPKAFCRMTAALRIDDRFVVHGLYGGTGELDDVRRELRRVTDSGAVTVDALTSDALPHADNLVNLVIVSNADCQLPNGEIERVLAPRGVVLLPRQITSAPERLFASDTRMSAVALAKAGHAILRENWIAFTKPVPPDIDDWTHLLYDAGNNAVSGDTTVAPPHRMRWVAAPLNARHHESLGSVSVVVSAAGKLFYIIDEAPVASILLPPAWALVARDAFSGVVLWKRTIPRWENHLRGFRSGPPELSRTLVATDDRLFVTLAQRAPLTALDPATGKALRRYPETEGAEEILLRGGVLYLATRNSGGDPKGGRGLMAVEAGTGRVLWQRNETNPLPMSLAATDGRVVYMEATAVVSLDAATGKEHWRMPRAVDPKRPGWSAPTVVLHDDVVLVADRWPKFKSTKDEVTGKPIAGWLAREGWTGDLIAYAAATGSELWRCPCAEAYHAPPDVFVIDGLVWVGQSRSRTGPDFVAARDLHTGEVKRELDTSKAWDTTMPHHRCHRNRATARYIIAGRTGVEFIDVANGASSRHHWTRGTCQFGTLPANGLLYVPPHSCACYIEGKLTGFLALAPKGSKRRRVDPSKRGEVEGPNRLEKGPVYASPIRPSAIGHQHSADWPTHRGDAARSAFASQTVPGALGVLWEADIGGRLSSPVVAEGKAFVTSVDAHTVHALAASSGLPAWRFVAGGRVDSPPTVSRGRVVFGAADGTVTCLRIRDGDRVWRFRVSPEERRIMAFGQLESAWPVHGSVLIQDDRVYFVAGRSSYLDGGLMLYCIDLTSGKLLARRSVYTRNKDTGEQPDEPIMFEMPGALPDVLAAQGDVVAMRHLVFDRNTLEPRPPVKHVYSPAGFLNGDWWHRTYWIDGHHFYSGYIGWYFAGREAPAGRLLAFTKSTLYGYGYAPAYYRGARERKYHLFAMDRSAQPTQPPPDYKRANRAYPHGGVGQFSPSFAWTRRVPLLVRSMVLTPDRLLVAGPPETALTERGIFDGENGARLAVVSTKDGATQGEYKLASLPVYDGMAAAGGRLFVSLQDGRLLCAGAGGRQTPALSRIKPLEERLPTLRVEPARGLAGYWKLDEGLGDMARDSSGGKHTGVVAGDWVKGDFGTCVRVRGVPSAVTLPDGPHLRPGAGSFSLEMWVCLEAHDCRLLGKEAFPKNWWVVNVLSDGRAEFVMGCGKGSGQQVRAATKAALPLDAWVHVAYVVDREAQTVLRYINGQRDGTTQIPADLAKTAFDVKGSDLRIPAQHKPFRGLFDEFKFYHRALSSDDVQAAYRTAQAKRTSVECEK